MLIDFIHSDFFTAFWAVKISAVTHDVSKIPPMLGVKNQQFPKDPGTILVGGWTNPFEKILVKMDHFPK